jgi:hypothetical protein
MSKNEECPVLSTRGVPEGDQTWTAITLEYASPITKLQALALTRRCAISGAMAVHIASLAFGGGQS